MPRTDGTPNLWDLPIEALANRAQDAGYSSNAAMATAASAILQARVALNIATPQENVTRRLVEATDRLVAATRGLRLATLWLVVVGLIAGSAAVGQLIWG
jgi:hypothetical protein